jgi:hypothetical protein
LTRTILRRHFIAAAASLRKAHFRLYWVCGPRMRRPSSGRKVGLTPATRLGLSEICARFAVKPRILACCAYIVLLKPVHDARLV